MELEIRHCRVLVAVHETGGVAAAARALGLAQSTVSETLLSLERVLGTAVTLRRAGREATLTSAADALLPHARALILASAAALSAVAGQGQALLRLGTVESISSFLLPKPLSAFRQLWPCIDVQVTVGLCDDLRKRVRSLELDAVISIDGEDRIFEDEGGWAYALSAARLGLLVSPGNPLAAAVLSRAELGAQTFLLADPDGAFNRLLRAWTKDVVPRPRFESAGSVDGVKRGIRNSDAIAVLPTYAVAEELSSGSLVGLRVCETLPVLSLVLISREPPSPSSPLDELVEQISEAFRVERLLLEVSGND